MEQVYGVWAVRSAASMFGHAEAWCKEDGRPLEFESLEAAQAYALELNRKATANVRYFVKEKEPEPNAVRVPASQPDIEAVGPVDRVPRNEVAEKHNEIPGRRWRRRRTRLWRSVLRYTATMPIWSPCLPLTIRYILAGRNAIPLPQASREAMTTGRLFMLCERYAGNVLFPLWGRLVALTGGNAGPGADDGSVYGICPPAGRCSAAIHPRAGKSCLRASPSRRRKTIFATRSWTWRAKRANYNMIDGIVNNDPPGRADLTDGQTHEEIRELAPETLPNEKPSIMEKLRADRTAHEARGFQPSPPERGL